MSIQAMEDMEIEGMDDDGGDDGADDMNEALEDMEEIDEYVQNRAPWEILFRLPSQKAPTYPIFSGALVDNPYF